MLSKGQFLLLHQTLEVAYNWRAYSCKQIVISWKPRFCLRKSEVHFSVHKSMKNSGVLFSRLSSSILLSIALIVAVGKPSIEGKLITVIANPQIIWHIQTWISIAFYFCKATVTISGLKQNQYHVSLFAIKPSQSPKNDVPKGHRKPGTFHQMMSGDCLIRLLDIFNHLETGNCANHRFLDSSAFRKCWRLLSKNERTTKKWVNARRHQEQIRSFLSELF